MWTKHFLLIDEAAIATIWLKKYLLYTCSYFFDFYVFNSLYMPRQSTSMVYLAAFISFRGKVTTDQKQMFIPSELLLKMWSC